MFYFCAIAFTAQRMIKKKKWTRGQWRRQTENKLRFSCFIFDFQGLRRWTQTSASACMSSVYRRNVFLFVCGDQKVNDTRDTPMNVQNKYKKKNMKLKTPTIFGVVAPICFRTVNGRRLWRCIRTKQTEKILWAQTKENWISDEYNFHNLNSKRHTKEEKKSIFYRLRKRRNALTFFAEFRS